MDIRLARPGERLTALSLWCAVSYVPLRFAQMTPHGEAFILPDGTLILSHEPDPDWNWGFIYGRDDPEGTAASFVARIREARVPGTIVAASPVASRVAPVAATRGLSPVEAIPLMLLEQPGRRMVHGAPVGVRMGPVTDDADIPAVWQVWAEAFGTPLEMVKRVYRPVMLDLPGVRAYAAWIGDEMVSFMTSAPEADVGWFFDLGTKPAQRGQGIASALLDFAMHDYAERGYHRFGLIADAEAVPLYNRLGFEAVDQGIAWLVKGP